MPSPSFAAAFSRYPNAQLGPHLFRSWPLYLRFDLQSDVPIDDDAYFQEVVQRACQLFEAVFQSTDSVVIIFQHWGKKYRVRQGNYLLRCVPPSTVVAFRRIVFAPFFSGCRANRAVRAYARVRVAHLAYRNLLTATSHQDFPSRKPLLTGEVYFLNERTGLILHMYDDRGLDILGPDAASLRELHSTFNHLILDYDRARIEALLS